MELPVIEGKIEERFILRQSAGSGSCGDAQVELATTGGLGGFALVIEVHPKRGKSVYVMYDGQPIVEAVARAVLNDLEERKRR